jgi:DNA-binding NtrC family response regulator
VTLLSTALIEGPEPRLEIEAAEISIAKGPDRGTTIQLGCESLLIGSGADCDVVLHDPTVSAHHAEIACVDKSYRVRDLGSTNGIVVGDQPIERAPLIDGMRMRLGSTVLSVRALGKKHMVPLAARDGRFGALVAQSVKMRAAVAILTRLAEADITVLIEGETGAGKEEAARALHAASARAGGPFVVFDCGAVPLALMGAELFGHERGAFSGADRERAGLLAQAEGGTLFLDEIGDLPREIQPILLGAIERKVSRRLGGQTDVAHDLRVVAATHRNLAEEVRAGRFREDLFFRLSAGRVRIPPLRERTEDIPVLAGLFARELGTTLTQEMLSLLELHSWPGNVRELRNAVARVTVDPSFRLDAQPPKADDPSLFNPDGTLRLLSEARGHASDQFEARYLRELMRLAGDDPVKGAELAGVSRQFITRLWVAHGLRPKRGG